MSLKTDPEIIVRSCWFICDAIGIWLAEDGRAYDKETMEYKGTIDWETLIISKDNDGAA